jgi:hypothetical protein
MQPEPACTAEPRDVVIERDRARRPLPARLRRRCRDEQPTPPECAVSYVVRLDASLAPFELELSVRRQMLEASRHFVRELGATTPPQLRVFVLDARTMLCVAWSAAQ